MTLMTFLSYLATFVGGTIAGVFIVALLSANQTDDEDNKIIQDSWIPVDDEDEDDDSFYDVFSLEKDEDK